MTTGDLKSGSNRQWFVLVIFFAAALLMGWWVFHNYRWHGEFVIDSTGWSVCAGGEFEGVEVFSAPVSAKKFVRWRGQVYCVSAGGLFPLLPPGRLGKPITVADGIPPGVVEDAFVLPSGEDLFVRTTAGIVHFDRGGVQEVFHPPDSDWALVFTEEGAFPVNNPQVHLPEIKGVISLFSPRFMAVRGNSPGIVLYDSSGNFYRVSGYLEKFAELRGKVYSSTFSRGNLYVATCAGLVKLYPDGTTQLVPTTGHPTTAVSVEGDTVFAGGFWGVDVILGGEIVRTIRVPTNWGAVRDVVSLGGKIFICGDGGLMDEDGVSLSGGYLPDNRITAICEFRGDLWVGTSAHGVARFDGSHWIPEPFPAIPFVNDIATDGVHLWVATEDGLVQLRPFVRVFSRNQGLNSNTVECLHYDGEKLWAGTNRGVCALMDFGWKQYYISDGLCGDHIYSIDGAPGDIWVATYGGLTHFASAESRCWRRVDGALKNDWATAVAVCEDGIFVGTYGGGIARYFRGRWSFYADGAVINPDAVALWHGKPVFGTAGDGILVWNGADFEKLGPEEGVPVLEVLSLFARGDYIYIGTPEGLIKTRLSDGT